MGVIQDSINTSLSAVSKVAIAKGVGDKVIDAGAEKLANDTVKNEVNPVFDKINQINKEADTGRTIYLGGREIKVYDNEKLQEGQKLYGELVEKLKGKGFSDEMINNSIGSALSKGTSYEEAARKALKKSAKEVYLKQHNTNSWKAGVDVIFKRLIGGDKE